MFHCFQTYVAFVYDRTVHEVVTHFQTLVALKETAKNVINLVIVFKFQLDTVFPFIANTQKRSWSGVGGVTSKFAAV